MFICINIYFVVCVSTIIHIYKGYPLSPGLLQPLL